MILATTEGLPGRRVVRVLGLVRGSSVRTRHVGRDVLAFLRSLVGGELPEYTKLIAEAREQALQRMCDEAQRLGADAVVAIRFGTSEMFTTAAEALFYGTAVVLDEAAIAG